MADSGFFANLRNAMQNPNLTVPSPLERPQLGAPQNQNKSNANRQTQVWGFEQDKANYGNERDASKLEWKNYTVHNNDTGEDKIVDIGYDRDGRISGVKEWNGPAYKDYYGQDMIGNFFKMNFNRDASDYTVYAPSPEKGWVSVKFDTKNDGEFIPSVVFDHKTFTRIFPKDTSHIDGPSPMSDSDVLKGLLLEPEVNLVSPDMEKYESALRGTLDADVVRSMPQTKEDWDFFEQNSDGFAGMAREFSRTPDANTRRKILEEAYKKYGKLQKFANYLEIMASDEQAYKDGIYPDYDYTRVGKDIGDAIDIVYKTRYQHA